MKRISAPFGSKGSRPRTGTVIARWLVVAAIAWPVLLGATLWMGVRGVAPAWTSSVYAACSRICHQKTERSFHLDGVAWPVCARCSGLYAAAPFGALVAWRRRRVPLRSWRRALVVACVPTAVTLAVEWSGLSPLSNVIRAVSALPAGALIAAVLVGTARGASEPIE